MRQCTEARNGRFFVKQSVWHVNIVYHQSDVHPPGMGPSPLEGSDEVIAEGCTKVVRMGDWRKCLPCKEDHVVPADCSSGLRRVEDHVVVQDAGEVGADGPHLH